MFPDLLQKCVNPFWGVSTCEKYTEIAQNYTLMKKYAVRTGSGPNTLDKFQLWKLAEEARACAAILFSFFLYFLLLNNHRQDFPALRIILVVVVNTLSLLILTNIAVSKTTRF